MTPGPSNTGKSTLLRVVCEEGSDSKLLNLNMKSGWRESCSQTDRTTPMTNRAARSRSRRELAQ